MDKVSKKSMQKDPYAAREAEKYSNPVPSREFITSFLNDLGKMLSHEKMCELLELTSPEQHEALNRRLKAMVRDGQLMKNRKGSYGLISKMNLIAGRVISHKDGFGLVKPDNEAEPLILSERQMRQVFHGDRVLVRPCGTYRRRRQEAVIVEVIERNTRRIVGRLDESDGVRYVTAENQRIKQQVLVTSSTVEEVKEGDVVVIEITSQPGPNQLPAGIIIEVLGTAMDPGMEIDIAIRSNDLPYQWNEEVIAEVEKIPNRVLQADKDNRKDITHLPLVTIDGEDAKDFDDAVFCKKVKNGWQLLVAIADVSHYVRIGTALDKEAEKRGNSVYFPGRVIPMLPAKLSDGLCSLKPNVDRLCMVCQIEIDKQGELRHYAFFPAVMYSHARLTYNKVTKILVEQDKALISQYEKLHKNILDMQSLYHLLFEQRQKRGAIDFEFPETQIIFGKNKKIQKIVARERTIAHRIIEEFMLFANVCAADFLLQHKIPALYRVHPGPDIDKLDTAKETLGCFGLHLKGGNKPTPKHYQEVLHKIVDRPDAGWLQMLLLRSLDQAVYQVKNGGHFGLAYKAYTHFTSPIRRYPDLLVHRTIKYILAGKAVKKFYYSRDNIQHFGEHCSMTERRADEATRDAIDWLKCEFMLDKLGKTYPGVITGVTPFGLFVCLDSFFIDGLVHITSLKNDYYQFDAKKQMLIGERTRTKYKLGDKMKVKVVRVSLENREIDFEMVL